MWRVWVERRTATVVRGMEIYPLKNVWVKQGLFSQVRKSLMEYVVAYPEMEGIHKDCEIQLLVSHRTTQNPNPEFESIVQTSWGACFSAHCPLEKSLLLTPPQVPSGPVTITESRAQHCPALLVRSCSHHEGSCQLPYSALSTLRDLSHSSHILPF